MYKILFIVVAEGVSFPTDWDPPDKTDPYRKKDLSPSSAEYQEVVTNVRRTGGSRVNIIKVCIYLLT